MCLKSEDSHWQRGVLLLAQTSLKMEFIMTGFGRENSIKSMASEREKQYWYIHQNTIQVTLLGWVTVGGNLKAESLDLYLYQHSEWSNLSHFMQILCTPIHSTNSDHWVPMYFAARFEIFLITIFTDLLYSTHPKIQIQLSYFYWILVDYQNFFVGFTVLMRYNIGYHNYILYVLVLV